MKKHLRLFTITFLFTFNIYSSVYSSQKPGTSTSYFSDKSNSRLSDKKDKPVLSDEQMKGFLDENGNPLFNNDQKPSDTLETDAFQERILNGMAAGDFFGFSVSGAGDVNGDGYEDIIVGAYSNDAGGADAGRAYIFFGGAIFNSTPDVIISGSAAGNNLGYSVSSAGDVNGDSYDDVIVGLSGYSASTGRAQIYLGGASMNNSADHILTGEVAGDYFGSSVSDAGDVNGDGFSDVIIGASGSISNTGKAYIYFGGSPMNTVVDVTLSEPGTGKAFGASVSGAGDFNGDGFSDVIIGAFLFSSNLGRAYIYLGGSSMNSLADATLSGAVTGINNFGNSVSDAGDVNGDGYGDVVVGSNAWLNNYQGRAYVFYGSATINSTIDFTLTGEVAGDNFGISVSSAGDANGDGYDDILVGANTFAGGYGKAYLYNGGENMDGNADKFFNAENAGDQFGAFVSGCGDINGDGNSDIIVGANFNDINGASSGRAYIYFNTMTGADIEDLTFTGAAAFENLGQSVSSAGDVNSDGNDDIIIGVPGYNGDQGRAYIYLGGSSMNNTADVTLNGVAGSDNFGGSVSSAGDVNGDGFSDVIVGATGYLTNQGRAYIYYGGSSMNSTIDVTLTGAFSNDAFGYSVSKAGDVNGDGYGDVIVGAVGYNSSEGRAFIYFGGSPMNSIEDVSFGGLNLNDYFGNSVSYAGDVNGDGFSDVIVGANGYNSGTYQGLAKIYFGGSSMNTSADVTLTGVSAGDNFGKSVSTAGDMNGDGFSDVIVGAYGYNNLGSNQGRAYVYFGGISMNSTADVSLTGILAGEFFGYSVSSAGDVNGDGNSDVIVGTLNNRVNIFFGGSTVNSSPDLFYTGENPNQGDNFGYSVAGAGDVNGDGLSDLIIGANTNNDGGVDAGKAYLYFSSSPVINPRITSVKDVPFDQGGKVKLKWIRSGYDYLNQNLITGYLIEKSDPPGGGGFYWEALATVPATMNPAYQYTATTPNDSLNGNSGVQYYRITAQTSDIDQFWRSNVMSGYSIDNISPAAPTSLAAFPDLNSVYLNWNGNNETDFHHYNIYRNGILLYTSLINNFDDLSVIDDSVYNYTVAAVDIHGNISPLSNIANVIYNNAGNLNLTVVMEGFYNSALNNMAISDTARVYLRSSDFPFAIVDSSKSIINGITLTGSFRISNAPTGNYYIVVKHRNTIETWSSSAVLYTSLSTINYDFTNLITKAFGNNMKQADTSPVRFALYSGDINQDGTIDASDVSNVDNDAFSSLSGYVITDVTGDNFVDAADVSIVDNNAFNSVSVIEP